ncbi:aldehyde dehydrogenase [Abortiporus biennis]|nr:aldehyde dehydrogenase [Abortiporus biennis]
MPGIFTYKFDTPVYKGESSFSTGLFVNGEFVDGSNKTTIDIINPSNGKLLTKISEGTPTDIDIAVKAARHAFDTSWGLKVSGSKRGLLLNKLADLIEENFDELAALEALDNGNTFSWAKKVDVQDAVDIIRYYAGWADKIHGSTIETTEDKLVYVRNEPVGVVGQIIPWNFPIMMIAWKLGPALATGNTVVLKPSELTPLTALRMAELINEAGFPLGVVNIVIGYGNTVGQAISEHMDIEKVAFTGSTLVGRKIMEASATTNLKKVTLELGGKSPNIIFDDANLEQAVAWAAHGIFWNHGQSCSAGSRIMVQEGIYEEFLKLFTEKAKAIKVGDPFDPETFQGPQISQIQYDRIMGYIESGKSQGATVHYGGHRIGTKGYFISPTIFTNTQQKMRIVQEEIFGPVAVIVKFKDEDDAIQKANDTTYGLASAVFSQNINRAITVAHRLKAGTAWINCVQHFNPNVPFGGYKQSGIGRELGKYALDNYTNVKAVHVNLGHRQ